MAMQADASFWKLALKLRHFTEGRAAVSPEAVFRDKRHVKRLWMFGRGGRDKSDLLLQVAETDALLGKKVNKTRSEW